MAEFLESLLVSSISGTLLAALLFLAKPFVKDNISHRSQYFSWYLVFLRMLLPFSFGGLFIGNLLPSLGSPAMQSAINPVMAGDPSAMASAVTSSVGNADAGSAVSQAQAGGIAQAAHSSVFLPNNWSFLLFTLWLLGAFALLGINLAGYVGYGRRMKSSRRRMEDAEITALLKECSVKLRLPRPLPVYVSSCTDTPVLTGLLRCSIVLPDRSFTPEQLRHAFTHELAHYRRHDNLLKWVSVLAVCVNWFNPVIYFAVREAGRQCELACDETVTAGFSREERIGYGKTLLAVASGSNHPFSLSATMSEDKRNLKERLEALVKAKNRGKKTAVLSVSLFSIAAILTAATLMVSCATSPVSSAQASAGNLAGTSGPENSSGLSAASGNTPSQSYLDNFVSYAQNHGFKTLTNSSIAGFIQLPSSFSGAINGFDIGSFLEDRNALSKQNGFDFSGYAGKVLTVYACDGEKRQPGDSELTEVGGGADTVCIVGLYDGGKIVGFWSHGFSDKDDDFSILSNYLNDVPNSPAGYSSNADYSARIVNTISNTWKTKYSDIIITNGWLSAVAEVDARYVALAGVLKSDPRQGVVEVVTTHRDGTTVKSDRRFLCPRKDGALTVTEIGAKDTTMGLRDADGHSWNFHIFNGFDPQTPVDFNTASSELTKDDLNAEWVQNNTQLYVQSKDAKGFTQLDLGFFISNGKVSRIIMNNENP